MYYRERDGRLVIATVVKVHYDEAPPYYTVSIEGTERSTLRDKLFISQENAAQPYAAAPPDGELEAPEPAKEPPEEDKEDSIPLRRVPAMRA